MIINTFTPGIDKCRKPNFTANLKGSAVSSAISKAKNISELGQIREILDDVQYLGDKTTKIICENNGLVTVSNSKFGNIEHSFKMKLNEKSDNPFIEMLARFNLENFIMKCELDLIDKRFAMSKQSSKKALYDLYLSNNLALTTECALKFVADKHGIIPPSKAPKLTLENVKEIMFPEYLKK